MVNSILDSIDENTAHQFWFCVPFFMKKKNVDTFCAFVFKISKSVCQWFFLFVIHFQNQFIFFIFNKNINFMFHGLKNNNLASVFFFESISNNKIKKFMLYRPSVEQNLNRWKGYRNYNFKNLIPLTGSQGLFIVFGWKGNEMSNNPTTSK